MNLRDLIRGRPANVKVAKVAKVPPPTLQYSQLSQESHSQPQEFVKIESMSLADFGRSGLVVRVDSEVVGEEVLFVADGYRPAPGDPISYTADELEALLGSPPEVVRLVHSAKRTFPGARVVS